jgi:hypothetical protein
MMLAAALSDRLAATARAQDYEEYFRSVVAITYDSDSDGYDDSVTLQIEVDTTGGYVYVIVEAFLEDEYGYEAAYDDAAWSIYGDEIESRYFEFTVVSGDPGDYSYYLDLYDDFDYWEDEWYGSVYLYPIGYGATSTSAPTSAPTLWRPQQPFTGPTLPPVGGTDVGDALTEAALAGIVIAVLIVTVPGLLWTRKKISKKNSGKRTKAPDARIAKLRAQMEQWRDEGYDVSELEDLFR